MPTYYVGPGGNDGNDGLSWANRFLTLNGAEDEPVAAGDTVYVAPGIYRELLTCDVSGSSGQPITYIGDVTGVNTDNIGGVVRITGSDNDLTGVRAYCVYSAAKEYRTFRGFSFDLATTSFVRFDDDVGEVIIEDCYFGESVDFADEGLRFWNCVASDTYIIRRCFFIAGEKALYLANTSGEVAISSSSLIENCIFFGSAYGDAVHVDRVVGFDIKNCLFFARDKAVFSATATTGSFDVLNSIFVFNVSALEAQATGDIVEDYNAVPGNNATQRTNVNTGSNSNAYPMLGQTINQAYRWPWNLFMLSKDSQLTAIAGSSEATEDFFGITRPTTSSKKSWGPIQYQPATRETTETRGSSAGSLKLPDAGRTQITVPVFAASTTISVYVKREANYAGTNPQMIIKEPGQSDRTKTDAGSSGSWNELTDTFTPSGDVDFVIVELVSDNTATSGSYAAYFDDLAVT